MIHERNNNHASSERRASPNIASDLFNRRRPRPERTVGVASIKVRLGALRPVTKSCLRRPTAHPSTSPAPLAFVSRTIPLRFPSPFTFGLYTTVPPLRSSWRTRSGRQSISECLCSRTILCCRWQESHWIRGLARVPHPLQARLPLKQMVNSTVPPPLTPRRRRQKSAILLYVPHFCSICACSY